MIYTSLARASALSALGYANNPVVAWKNLGASAILGGTASLADGDAANAVTGTTYDYWLPNVTGATATLSFQLSSASAVDFAGIEAHNLFELGASVQLQRSTDGITWADAGYGSAVTPPDKKAIAIRIVSSSYSYWRFLITGLTAGDNLYIGVAFIGVEMIFPQRFYQGFAPVIEATEVQLQSNVSVGGNLLGSSVVASGSTISTQINHLIPSFVRGSECRDFIRQFNRGTPFFFGWRPNAYAQDLHYCWREGAAIRPDNSGPRDLMSMKIEARAYHG